MLCNIQFENCHCPFYRLNNADKEILKKNYHLFYKGTKCDLLLREHKVHYS